MLPLHCDHGAQLGQRQRSLGHQLIPHVWIIIPDDEKKKTQKTTINDQAD